MRVVRKILTTEALATSHLATNLEVLSSTLGSLQGIREALIKVEAMHEMYKTWFDWATFNCNAVYKKGFEQAKTQPGLLQIQERVQQAESQVTTGSEVLALAPPIAPPIAPPDALPVSRPAAPLDALPVAPLRAPPGAAPASATLPPAAAADDSEPTTEVVELSRVAEAVDV